MVQPADLPPENPAKIDWSERRGSARQPVLETSRRLVAAIGADFCPAKVRNISPDGICLVVTRSMEVGSVLTVDLIDTKANRFSRTLEVRVCWCIEHPSGDWLLGGSFNSRLSQEELDYFLKQ